MNFGIEHIYITCLCHLKNKLESIVRKNILKMFDKNDCKNVRLESLAIHIIIIVTPCRSSCQLT